MTHLKKTISILLLLLLLSQCSTYSKIERTNNSNKISSNYFSKTTKGEDVILFTLKNSKGMEVQILNLGAAIKTIKAPDRKGHFTDIVLGFDNIQGYEKNSSVGAFIGRYANRISDAQFEIDGKKYYLAKNWKKKGGSKWHTIHGGEKRFSNSIWEASSFENDENPSVKLKIISHDGDQGFPGELTCEVTYTLTEDNTLILNVEAKSTKDTHINFTQHSYFNLQGHGSENILDHKVKISADTFAETNEELIPSGKITSVKRTPFDFLTFHFIGERINDSTFLPLAYANGYDHYFFLTEKDPEKLKLAAEVLDEKSGRMLAVFTTEPGLQFFTANNFSNIQGKEGALYNKHAGFCLETQHAPDSPNRPEFPSTLLKKENTYRSKTVYVFKTDAVKNDQNNPH